MQHIRVQLVLWQGEIIRELQIKNTIMNVNDLVLSAEIALDWIAFISVFWFYT